MLLPCRPSPAIGFQIITERCAHLTILRGGRNITNNQPNKAQVVRARGAGKRLLAGVGMGLAPILPLEK